MGSILITVPDFSDDELIFDEEETRRILKFFWPHIAESITGMTVDHDVRRLAQSGLVAAIDGSYAMGFIYALGETVVRPGSGVKSLAVKLARRYASHWWRHTKQRDLLDVKIFDSMKKKVALALLARLGAILNGVALRRGVLHFYASIREPLRVRG